MFRPDLDPTALALLVRVSRMYYEQGLTQQQIARVTGLSRPTISRTLERAKRSGVVQIRVLDPAGDSQALAHTLAGRFKLREVVLADAGPNGQESPRTRVGRKVGEYLQGLLRDGMTLGVTWGKTLQEMALTLKPAHLANLTVVQMMGGLAVLEESMETTRLAQEVARILGGRAVQLQEDVLRQLLGPGPIADEVIAETDHGSPVLLEEAPERRLVAQLERDHQRRVGVRGHPFPLTRVFRPGCA